MIKNKRDFKARIQKIDKLGEGSYGTVYQVKDFQLNRIMALKKIKFPDKEEGIPPTTIREIALLREMKHENIIGLKDIIYYPSAKKFYLLFDFIDMDLRHFIDIQPRMSLEKIRRIFCGIVKGVDYLHGNSIFHRDLKPQNILIDKNGICPKLADFGLARHFSLPFGAYSKEIVTLWYRAPEVIMADKKYGIGVDIWSLGCIFYELFMQRPLFMGDCQVDTLYLIFQILGTPSETTWPEISEVPDWNHNFPKFKGQGFSKLIGSMQWDAVSVDLLTKMLQFDPLKRITCQEILNHRFFYEKTSNFLA